jgi:hypothetical protein
MQPVPIVARLNCKYALHLLPQLGNNLFLIESEYILLWDHA